jgi:LmbE family N-acetylglucosaminyl deacetylase
MKLYRILAIHAHPDDLEILAGGTLALLAEQGHTIRIATMTPGDCGSHEFTPEETATVRRREATAAAALIKAEYRCVEFRDLAVFNDDDSRRRVTEVLREAQPEIVITAPPLDYHCDHENTSTLVRDACFAAPAPNYKTRGSAAPIDHIPHLYFTQPASGVDREDQPMIPDFVVDVASTFAMKTDMLARHESQRNWLRAHHGVDEYLDMMERWTRDCGKLAGLEFGEGFRRYKGQPYPQTPVLEELLGSHIRLCSNR